MLGIFMSILDCLRKLNQDKEQRGGGFAIGGWERHPGHSLIPEHNALNSTLNQFVTAVVLKYESTPTAQTPQRLIYGVGSNFLLTLKPSSNNEPAPAISENGIERVDTPAYLLEGSRGAYKPARTALSSLDFVVPPIDALTSFFDSSAKISTSLPNDLKAGPNATKGNDVALVFVNAMSGELGSYNIVAGNMGDRSNLELWWGGGKLSSDLMQTDVNP
ncbi:hypothetical protein M378DRAFT_18455 [Amanita muscaria Koide BX008]|uniref:Uncharacterized protein n=1 Tax=Amanita muscaria (strain Koide BX008) TaxID=946122 RepID=A0A0C2RX49_AMAMK|nr:hypothetical protein M378DRAFT_18455 [Amanita muscaria Koide BX008]